MMAGSADEQDPAAAPARVDHPLGNRRDGQLLRPFGRHFARHEAEDGYRILAGRRHHLDACFVDEHAIVPLHAVQGNGQGVRSLGRVLKHHAAVHLDVLDRQPSSGVADVAFEVGRRVEVLGEDAVRRRDRPLGVVRDRRGAMLPDLLQDPVEAVLRLRPDDDLRVAGGVPRRADVERGDLVVAAVQQDQIEHFRQRARIDDVAIEVHRFREHRAAILSHAGERLRTRG